MFRVVDSGYNAWSVGFYVISVLVAVKQDTNITHIDLTAHLPGCIDSRLVIAYECAILLSRQTETCTA